ncbi:ATP-binding protein [Natronolimnobius sp. AArcel1]|nr:ATP-binding protein [Natronolimnobius sp. AArcel1]
MVRFDGIEERRKDWMTTLTTFDLNLSDRSPLSNMLETIVQSKGTVLIQMVFEPRADWSRKAERHKGNLKQGVHSTAGLMLRSFIDALFGVSQEEKQERHRGDTPHEIGGTIHDSQTAGPRSGTSRMAQIDLKDPAHTYNLTIRAATSQEKCAQNLQDSLNQLSGQFYSIEGKYLGKHKNEYERMLKHALTYPTGWEMITRRKPMLVCNIKELASFITVPSIDSLPKASRGGTGGLPAAQSPLTSPNEEVFQKFSNGMTIGHAVTAIRDNDQDTIDISAIESKNEWTQKINHRDALSLSASDLTHHYIRAATTGSGKTVATINDMLTAHQDLDGPLILIDPKNGDMCENYLRCHRTLFGSLEDVEYIQIPEKNGKIPGMPFFDLRPLTRGAGREREAAIQDITDHYFQVLRFVLGRDTVDQAFVANEILKNLIKAKFDRNYGTDYFSIGELMEAAQQFQQWGKEVEDAVEDADKVNKAIPRTTDSQVRSILESHLTKDQTQFMNTTDAVLNRIRKLKERDFIWNMLSYTISEEYWDDENNWYDHSEIPMLDLKNILNSNKVLILDTGNLRSQSSQIFTVLFLSHLWTSVQSIWTPNSEDYITNVIIEESSDVARNEIVYNELLPKGREFNLSLGLIMQYPEQVLGEDPHANRRAYKEILNNVNTKIIGNIATDDMLAESLFHEDLETEEIKDRIAGLRRGEWVVQLPSTGFHESKPEILTLRPLPIPPGHKEGPFEVSPKTKLVRRRSRERHCLSRDHEAIDDTSGTRIATAGEENEPDEPTKSARASNTELSHQEIAFLEMVFDALTDGVKNYTLAQPMKELHWSEYAEDLVDQEYLEKIHLGRYQVYYYPTEKAQVELDRDLSPKEGGEYGGESPLHRIGTRLIATYYDQQGYDVSMYHTLENGDNSQKLDVYAKDTKESPDNSAKLVEVEITPEHRPHVEGDYEKLAEGYGDAIWVVENYDGAETLLNSLSNKLEDTPSKGTRSFEKINETLDDPGASKILGINNLREMVE